jgi:quinolinate synthase
MIKNDSDLQNFGFLNVEIPESIDFAKEIEKLKKEKNAVILGHFYIEGELQDISDYVGDSLQLSQQAAKTDADIIVFLGVHFMAETAKILSPTKKVIIPDLKAGCSLADSCPADDFEKFVKDHPGHTVISYVNTTAAIKALTDIVVTSSNARQIVESLPADEKIIFGPDRNLGNYINSVTGRNMILWDGACHVHKQFDLEAILRLKKENPDAKIIAHPECEKPVLIVSEHVGSTASLLKFTQTDDSKKYIVATESGILHQMRKASPQKQFIPAPALDSTCGCNDCNFMKLNTLKKLYVCLKYEIPEVTVDEQLRLKAEKSIKRMLEISEKLGL